jgi:hypothetical protein
MMAAHRGIVASLSTIVSVILLTACASGPVEMPRLVQDAVDAGQMDSRATSECTVGGELIAAIDSTTSVIRQADREQPWSSGFDENLPKEDVYVAICVRDASSVPALPDDISYFVTWQADLVGSGVLGGW